jgi:hypothetical protein
MIVVAGNMKIGSALVLSFVLSERPPTRLLVHQGWHELNLLKYSVTGLLSNLVDLRSNDSPTTSCPIMSRALTHHQSMATESKRDKKRREIIEKVEKQHAEKIQNFQQ